MLGDTLQEDPLPDDRESKASLCVCPQFSDATYVQMMHTYAAACCGIGTESLLLDYLNDIRYNPEPKLRADPSFRP